MLKSLIEKLNLSYDDFKIVDTKSIVKRYRIFGFYTTNPVGKENMICYWNNFKKHYGENL